MLLTSTLLISKKRTKQKKITGLTKKIGLRKNCSLFHFHCLLAKLVNLSTTFEKMMIKLKDWRLLMAVLSEEQFRQISVFFEH